MDEYALLVDLHRPGVRQGPGGETETRRAIQLAGLDPSHPLKIADIGCGTGAAALVLAQDLNAHITAVDLFPAFLDELHKRAQQRGVAQKISTLAGSMEALPFAADEYDVLWSEGAVYNMGFEAGVSAWGRFLKPGGMLVVSEITWLTATRPPELQSYWDGEYPEIDVASNKFSILERHGYCPEGYFVLPAHCWLDNYYLPIESRLADFLVRHGQTAEARAMVEAERQECALYKKYQSYYSYGVYVARKFAAA